MRKTKKYFLTAAFMVVLTAPLYSNDNIRFFWSFGDIGVSFDNLVNKFDPFPFINVGNINWIMKNGFGFGFHAFNVEGNKNWQQSLVLPVEISYSPFGDNDKYLFLTLYARGGWMIRFDSSDEKPFSERNNFFGAFGLRTAWFPLVGEHWSIFTGAFIEYTTKNELRMGVSIDTSIAAALAVVVTGLALAAAGSNNKDKEEEINPRIDRPKSLK